MKTSRFQAAFLVLSPAFLCACNFKFELQANASTSVGDRLPDPDIWIEEPPTLSDEQQARQAEVELPAKSPSPASMSSMPAKSMGNFGVCTI